MWRWALALLALLALAPGVPGVSSGVSRGSLSLPVPDGRSRAVPVTPANLGELRRRFPVLALLRRHGDTRQRDEERAALELVAQALEQHGVGFGLVDPEQHPELARELGLAGRGRLSVLRGSVVTEYPGEAVPARLLEFLSQALQTPVQVVAQQQLQAFGDIEEEHKAIGFFEGQHSASFQAFSAAAQLFHPSILFFATFDPQAAKELGLGLNQIDLYQPFLQQPRSLRGHLGDTAAIEAFLRDSQRTTLRKLKAQSVAEIWEEAPDGIHIVAFAEGDDPDGFEFLETLKEVAQDRRDNRDFSILWVDPDDFPELIPAWEETFGIDLARPQLGVVNGTDHASSVWLPMEEEEDLPGPEEVLEWLKEVLGDIGDSDDDDDDDDDDDEDDDDENEDHDDDDDDNDDDDNDDDDDDDDDDDNE